MRIFIMLAFQRVARAPNPVLVDIFHRLRQDGFHVQLGFSEELLLESDGRTPAHDLYVLKSHGELWLSLAGILHSQGARLLNPYPASVATLNKITALWRLRAAGIPAPRSWVTGDLLHLRDLVAERPLIIKPYNGMRANGIAVVHTPGELAALPIPQGPVLVQEYIPGYRDELKVYVVGSDVFALRRPSPLAGIRLVGRPCRVNDEVRKIALRCGQLFGLGLYGLDVLGGSDGPVVVDVNYFPSYFGVPNASSFIAAYIADYARGLLPELAPDAMAEASLEVPILLHSGEPRSAGARLPLLMPSANNRQDRLVIPVVLPQDFDAPVRSAGIWASRS